LGGAVVAALAAPHLADFHRLLDALQLVAAVVEPLQGADVRELLAAQRLAGVVEHRPRHEDLIGLRQGHHPRAGVHLHAMHVALSAAEILDHHLAQVQPHAIRYRHGLVAVELPDLRLEPQREPHGVGGFRKQDQERVAGGGNLLGAGEAGERLPDDLVMLLHHLHARAVAQLLLQRGGADDVGEEQGEDARDVARNLAATVRAGCRLIWHGER
jgi:hypothetical protein